MSAADLLASLERQRQGVPPAPAPDPVAAAEDEARAAAHAQTAPPSVQVLGDLPTDAPITPVSVARPDGTVAGLPPAPDAVAPPPAGPGAPPGAPPAPAGPPSPPLAAPVAPVGGVSQTTSSGKTTKTYTAPTEEAKRLQGDEGKLEQDAIKVEEEKGRMAAKVARQNELTAAHNSIIADEAATRKELEIAQHKQELQKRMQRADNDEAEYRQQLQNINNPKNSWWAERSTGQKIGAGLAMVLGAFGGGSDGSNVGADRVIQAAEKDTAAKKYKLENQLKLVEMSRKNADSFAANDLKQRIEMADVRTIAALNASAANAESRLKALGVPDAEIATNEGILKIKAAALAKRQEFEKSQSVKVEKEQAYNKVTMSGAGAGGASDTRLKPTEQDLNGINNGVEALRKIDEAVSSIDKTPAAWHEFSKNAQDWKRKEAGDKIPFFREGRAAFQRFGAADVLQEQGLKTQEAKNVYSAITQLRETMAKGFGGVVTESDRDAANALLATAATSDPAMAKRLLLQAKAKIENSMRLTIANRQIAIPEGILPGSRSTGATPATTAGPGGLPPGAIPGMARGHRGYMLNGMFHPTS